MEISKAFHGGSDVFSLGFQDTAVAALLKTCLLRSVTLKIRLPGLGFDISFCMR